MPSTAPAAPETPSTWERYAWAAGIVFVVALLVEGLIATGVGLTHQDGPAKVAGALDEHRERLLVIAYFSIVYAVAFVIYLWKLYRLLRGDRDPHGLSILVLVGGVAFVTLHVVSAVAITGLLGARLASYGHEHDPGLSYALYYMTFALDSVGDVFASLFFLSAGVLLLANRFLPRWLGWVSVVVAPLLLLQAFGLGGVIGDVRADPGPHRVRPAARLRRREQRRPAEARRRAGPHRRARRIGAPTATPRHRLAAHGEGEPGVRLRDAR